jgi:hypothetical protein
VVLAIWHLQLKAAKVEADKLPAVRAVRLVRKDRQFENTSHKNRMAGVEIDS